MMYFDNLHVMKFKPQNFLETTRFRAIFSTLVIMFVCSGVNAQELLEEIELPEPIVLKTGVPIPSLGEAANQAIAIDSDQPPPRQIYTGVRTYQLGNSVVREFRYGKQLSHIEVTNAEGTTYVVEQSHSYSGEDQDRQFRAGILVTTW